MKTTADVLADMSAAVRFMEYKHGAYLRAREEYIRAKERVAALKREAKSALKQAA